MRCSRCGNESPDGNRFCGMCGAALLSAPPVTASVPQRPVVSTPPVPDSFPSRPQPAEAPRSSATPQSQPTPSISGPSFLGLNDRSPHRRTRASLSIDPHSSSNVDYLLDDDDSPRHFGAGKVLLILIALGLAVGFGYLRWKNEGLNWLNLALHKPAAAQKAPATDSNSTDGNASGSPSITPEPAPASSTPAPVGAQPSDAAPPSGAQPSGTSGPNANAPGAATPSATAPASSPASTAPANNGAPAGDNGSANPPANTAAKPSDDSPAAENSSTETAAPTKGNSPTARPKPAPKPRAARPPESALDPVTEAHPYLYGRGAAQDCDRGLRILKPAANAGNPKAMIEMGALYSAGLCTPHDLPTAYRWFALALRKDPSNDQVQTDLQKLWSEMTQPERQLAIKLSQ